MSAHLNVYVARDDLPSFEAVAEQLNARSAAAVSWTRRSGRVSEFERGRERVHVGVQKLDSALRDELVEELAARDAEKSSSVERSETTVRVSSGSVTRLQIEIAAEIAEATGGVVHNVNSNDFFDAAELRSLHGLTEG